jgi:hypothetical protein
MREPLIPLRRDVLRFAVGFELLSGIVFPDAFYPMIQGLLDFYAPHPLMLAGGLILELSGREDFLDEFRRRARSALQYLVLCESLDDADKLLEGYRAYCGVATSTVPPEVLRDAITRFESLEHVEDFIVQ